MTEARADIETLLAPLCRYALPGETQAHGLPDGHTLHINLFGRAAKDNVRLSADGTVAGACYASPTLPPSTQYDEYRKNLQQLIEVLKFGDHKKTVISTVTTVDTTHTADQFFDHLMAQTTAFRCIYCTRQTGLWVVASPEVLLTYDAATDTYATMALAGTRPLGTTEPWDDKNREEQQFVADFIYDTLRPLASEITRHDTYSRGANGVEHLCTPFTFRTRLPWHQVADALSPTPALAGLPRHLAMVDIVVNEQHPRDCYGGYLAITDAQQRLVAAYVNLRCLRMDPVYTPGRVTFYAGGGITAHSEPTAEWAETRLKIKPLIDFNSK